MYTVLSIMKNLIQMYEVVEDEGNSSSNMDAFPSKKMADIPMKIKSLFLMIIK